MKTTIFKIVISLFLVLFTIQANAQQDFIVKLKMPPPGTLNTSDFYNVTVTNNSGSEQSGYLSGTAREENDGMIVQGTTDPILFKKGINKIKIKDLLKTPDVKYLASDPKYKKSLIMQGTFPSGNYEICVKLISAGSKEELGSDCINQEVLETGLLSLMSPANGENIDSKVPVTFTWSSGGKVPEGGYTIRICEVMNNQTPEIAMKSNKAFFEMKGIKATTFSYPISSRKFEGGKKYVWSINYGNIGSEVWGVNMIVNESYMKENMTEILFPKDKDTIYGKTLYVIWNNKAGNKEKYTYSINVSDALNGKEIFSKNELRDSTIRIDNFEKSESGKLKIELLSRFGNQIHHTNTVYVQMPRICIDFFSGECSVSATIYSRAIYSPTPIPIIEDVSIPPTDWLNSETITVFNDPAYSSPKLIFFVDYIIQPSTPGNLTFTIQDLGQTPAFYATDPLPGDPLPNYASLWNQIKCSNYNNNSAPVYTKVSTRDPLDGTYDPIIITLSSSPLISGHRYILRLFDQNNSGCHQSYMFDLKWN